MLKDHDAPPGGSENRMKEKGFLKFVTIDPEFTEEQLARRLRCFLYSQMVLKYRFDVYSPRRDTEDYLNSYELHADELEQE